MSDLNLASTVGNVYVKNNGLAVTTGALDLIPAIAANYVAMVDSIYVSNITGPAGADEVVTVTVVKSVGPFSFRFYQINVPKGTSIQLISKDLDLMEGDKIQVLAGTNSKLEAFASWKLLGP